MWSWDSRSGVWMLRTRSSVGREEGGRLQRCGWVVRSWERRVVERADSVEM